MKKNKDKYKNIIIEVSYFEETSNSDRSNSLRFLHLKILDLIKTSILNKKPAKLNEI